MAIAFDAATKSGDNVDLNGLTFAHTCTGSDLILFVGIMQNDQNGTSAKVTGVTYNGVAMTLMSRQQRHNYAPQETDFFYLLTPTTGSNNVVVASAASNNSSVVAWSYTGVGSVETNSSAANGSTTASATVTTVDAAAVLVGVADGFDSITFIPSTNFTNARIIQTNHLQVGDSIGTSLTPGSNSFVATTVSQPWSMSVASIAPAATTAVKTIDGLAKASVKTVDGLAIASVKTWNGLA